MKGNAPKRDINIQLNVVSKNACFIERLKLSDLLANTIDEVLQPRGVGVIIEASHLCVSTRGIHKPDTRMVTSRMLGSFRNDQATRKEFLDLVGFNKSNF